MKETPCSLFFGIERNFDPNPVNFQTARMVDRKTKIEDKRQVGMIHKKYESVGKGEKAIQRQTLFSTDQATRLRLGLFFVINF